jgi:hypothetical protein
MQNIESALEAQLKTLGDSLERTMGEWRSEDAANRQKLEDQIRGLEDEIGSVKGQLTEARSMSLPGVVAADESQARESFSMARACRALARKDFADAPYEREVFSEMKEKAMSQGTDTAGEPGHRHCGRLHRPRRGHHPGHREAQGERHRLRPRCSGYCLHWRPGLDPEADDRCDGLLGQRELHDHLE